MSAAPGREVGLYLDTLVDVAVGDELEVAHTGRRYLVTAVRVQQRGLHAGRRVTESPTRLGASPYSPRLT